jgi:acetyl esterase/lipase
MTSPLKRIACLAAACLITVSGVSPASEQVITIRSGIVFSPTHWPAELAADLYRPVACEPCPVVILVHGGGWVAGGRRQMSTIARGVAILGYAALAIEYRRAPQFTHPAAIDDVVLAMRWLRTHGDRIGLDADRMVLWGYSAGAQLAAMAALRAEAPRVRALVVGGMPAELTEMAEHPSVQAYLGGSLDAMPERYREASPLRQVSSQMPPVFMYHAVDDELVDFDQARRMKAALDALNIPAQLHPIASGGHAAAARLPASSLRTRLWEFIETHL